MGTTRESFGARPASTVQIAATTASASVALAGGNPIADQVRVVGGATDCRVEFGKSTVAVTKPNGATPGSALVKAGQTEVFTVPAGTTHVAAACDTGTATLEFTPGQGI